MTSKKLGELLFNWRSLYHLSEKAVSEYLGISAEALSLYEIGYIEISEALYNDIIFMIIGLPSTELRRRNEQYKNL